MSEGIPVMWMRGGTSKGGYFLAEDLPNDPHERDAVLLGIMGSPDPFQIDGMGGANPLTSKVAIVRRSARPDADVDYLFLQVAVDRPVVSDAQNCGNILAGVGPFAIERGLVAGQNEQTLVRVFMENTGKVATVNVRTPNGQVTYEGDANIDGVPGAAAPVSIFFEEMAGSSCGALFPTGKVCDTLLGVKATLIDNGMPVVVLPANDLGISGHESVETLEYNKELRKQLEEIRLVAGKAMKLGDVANKTVPKMTVVSPANHEGAIMTRTFIPHRCHRSIGVLGAISVATAVSTPGAIGNDWLGVSSGEGDALSIEHPTGSMSIVCENALDGKQSFGVLRTARKLMDGSVFPR